MNNSQSTNQPQQPTYTAKQQDRDSAPGNSPSEILPLSTRQPVNDTELDAESQPAARKQQENSNTSRSVPYGLFTVGSTKADVLAAEGTPDSLTSNSFSYGSSFVYFQNERVTGWRNGYPKLNVKLVPLSPRPTVDYFTVGSTKDDVIHIQGTPDSFSANSFTYGSSFVYFQNDRVSGWRNGYPRLSVRFVLSSPPPTVDYFTVGSTKDDVSHIQGTPDSFSANSFSYGSSFVYFQNDRVTGWRNGYPKLNVRLVPISPPPTIDYFTVGSTKDDVIHIQGTPDSFSANSFSYGSSFVYFQNGYVTSWRNGYPNLKVRL